MRLTLLDANPIIALGGQIAAIVLCISLLISVLLMLALNVGLAFVFAWIHEKAHVIKLLRPTVDSVNRSSEAALQGREIETAGENKAIHRIASLPGRVRALDQKAGQVSGKVANAVIELRARTVQTQTIVKTFFVPRANRQQTSFSASTTGQQTVSIVSGKSVEETRRAEEQQQVAVDDVATSTKQQKPAIPTDRRQHVPVR